MRVNTGYINSARGTEELCSAGKTSPGMRVNTGYINSARGAAFYSDVFAVRPCAS